MALPERSEEATLEPTTGFGPIKQQNYLNTDSGEVPVFIANGLGFAVSFTEMTALLMFSNRPVAAVILSPVMAKTMGEALLQMVRDYEKFTNQTVKSLTELGAVVADKPL